MAFRYHNIKDAQPLKDEVFLFDANVWIFYHDQTNPPYYAKPYNKFLNCLHQEPEDPKIILPAAVLSEVMNRLLKDNYCKKFLQSEAGKRAIVASNVTTDGEYYKKVYRPHQQYKLDRDNIYHRIFSYSQALILIEDQFDLVKHDDLTTAMTDLDFTDWMIYRLAQAHEATIVTDDSDFVIENYPILTHNKTLLGLMPSEGG